MDDKPRHIAIIPDGNRRWGELKGIPKKEAYAIGIRKIGDVLKWCKEQNVEFLTMWGFSTDNFTRDQAEIKDLFELFKHNLKEALESDEKNKYDVRVRFLGRINLFPKEISEMIRKAEDVSSKNKKHTLNLLLAYGGREEILDAVNQIIKDGLKQVDEATFSKYLYSKDIPDPDLVIRTSGEQRLSGLMPWQSTYSEFYFSQKLWPDFSKEDFLDALQTYAKRKRRFGK
ncbi:di-trans,poly-cis-decaprenylcistransferase [Candidatus Micrarchaeota archaeon]|nr:di-trans,poly-cis-decaprenylcistransferase [Candidatus Micrarchaeota archaeon]